MSKSLSVTRNVDGEVTVFGLDGFLDAHTSPAFEGAMQEALDAGRVKIAVDCAKLTYISSAGLGVFMSFVEEVREKGGDIKVCALVPKVRQIFEILGFHALYEIVDDVPEAVRRFAPREA